MNPLATILPSTSRPGALNTTSSTARNAADAQSTLSNRLAERLGLEPGSLSDKSNDYSPDKVAERVLGFIGQRLQSEAAAGGDTSKMQQLLDQAREGVEKGFAEARKILDGMGVLKGQVATDIDETYKRIQEGLSKLLEQFGTPATDTTGTPVSSATGGSLAAQAETFDMEVTTRDGDRVKISVAQASANWSQMEIGDGSTQSGNLRIAGFDVQVDGDLDDEEVAALEKLFGQVKDLSNRFYAGDMSGAFDRALALDMDGEQLASMSLQLTQTTVRQATNVYSEVSEQGGQTASVINGSLMEYAQGLLDALRTAGDTFGDGRESLQELLKGSLSLDERFDEARLEKADKLNDRLLDGLEKLNEQAIRDDASA